MTRTVRSWYERCLCTSVDGCCETQRQSAIMRKKRLLPAIFVKQTPEIECQQLVAGDTSPIRNNAPAANRLYTASGDTRTQRVMARDARVTSDST